MKKQKIQLFVLFGLLLIALGGYLGLKSYNEKKDNTPAETTEITAFTLVTDEVTAFSYDYEGEVYSFIKEDESWICEDDASIDIDESQISSMLGKMANITSDIAIEDVTDFEQYGLATPSKIITLTTGEEEYKLNLGDYNELISAYYIQVDGQDTVYTTTSYLYTAFDVMPQDLAVVVSEDVEETE